MRVMTRTVSIDEAKDQLQDLLALALEGNEVVITNEGKPLARLVPVATSQKKRIAGLNRGQIHTSEDFDEPLPDEFWVGQE
jgi:prevent-host-death family protein